MSKVLGTLLVAIVWVFACIPLFSQKKIDSLKIVLKTIPYDTSRANIYYYLSFYYIYNNGQFDLATKYADSVKIVSEELEFDLGIVKATYLFGLLNIEKGNYHEAINQIQSVVHAYEEYGDSLAIARALYSIGVIHNHLGEYDKNIAIQFRIVRIFEMKNDKLNLANSLSSIGNVYNKIGKLEDAKEMHEKATKIYKQLGLQKRYAMGLTNLANVYALEKNYDTATQLFESALHIIRRLELKVEEALILENSGYVLAELDQDDKAMNYHLRALNIYQELGQRKQITQVLDNIGYLHMKREEYLEAIKYFKQALIITNEFNQKSLRTELYRELAETYCLLKDFENAYDYSQLYTQSKDSLFNEKVTLQINELQTKYETEKKDRHITILEKEKQIQEKEAQRQATIKKASFVGLGLVTLLAISIGYVYHQKLKSQKLMVAKDIQLNEANFKSQMSELELKALRAQINPHFLFNCMNSINRMILDRENENASQYLAKFSKLVRLILENAESSKVSLQSELTLLESYIQLEALRFKGRINYAITVDPAIDPDSLYLPSMVLQPFVENAIWHGLMHKKEGEQGKVEVSIVERSGRLCCAIEDNGVGRERAHELAERSVLKTKSMGMKITEERLRLLSKQSWEKLVNIIDLKDSLNNALGTRVEINFPVS